MIQDFPPTDGKTLTNLDPSLPWRCPTCQQPAEVHAGKAGPEMLCAAGHRFGSIDGVLTLCEGKNYADSFGKQWLKYSTAQVDKYNGTNISRDRFRQITQWPSDLHGARVLEAGSGAGRYTQILLEAGAKTVTFDYSAAVGANLKNNGGSPNLTLFRGDIFKIPFAPESFDRVVCIGVVQHTPDPAAAFRSLVGMVRPGGELVVDVYRLGLIAVLHPKYYLRLFRKLVPNEKLFDLVHRAVPVLLPIKDALRKIPVVGVALGHMLVPVPDFHDRLPLTEEQCVQWSELDLFDWISPEHDHPATRWEVERWCREAHLENVEIVLDSKGSAFTLRGRKPAC